MNVLLSLRHSFALRNLEPICREMAERGHSVHVSFLSEGKAGSDRQAEALAAELPGITLGQVDARKHQRWFEFARSVRTLMDALRYRLPMYDTAPKLRARALRRLSGGQRNLVRLPICRWRWSNRLLTDLLRLVERGIPVDDVVLEEVRTAAPDLILVSPLVDFGSDQVDYVKAGRRLGIPTALVVNSWDNLTNKGLVRVLPDRVYVWNDVQRREAVEYHSVPEDAVEVTGAPTYDHWFGRAPASSPGEFKRRVGLDPDRPYLLYLCSSPFIAPREAEFVERWLERIRGSENGTLRDVPVLVRPHPENRQPWPRVRARHPEGVVVWPPGGANPVDRESRDDYFDSMHHSAVVVGINSSGLIEAGIVGRPVCTLLDPDFADTQEGTIHFHYLMNVGGGLLRVARSPAEHEAHLLAGLGGSGAVEANREFIRQFVRPLGPEVEATPVVVDSLVGLAQEAVPVRGPGLFPRVMRGLAWWVARAWSAVGKRRRRRRERLDPDLKRPTGDSSRHEAISTASAEVERIVHRLRRLAAGDVERVVVGPWRGGVEEELLYWIPFVRRAMELAGLRPADMVAITCGGNAAWYRGIASDHVEVYDYFTPAEIESRFAERAPVTGSKSKASSLDREMLRLAKRVVGVNRVKSLHPSVLEALLAELQPQEPLADSPVEGFFRHEVLAPEDREVPELEGLPPDYFVVHAGSGSSLADTAEAHRAFMAFVGRRAGSSEVVSTEAMEFEEVSAGTGLENRMHVVDCGKDPARLRLVQTALVAGARGYAGGLDLACLAALCGSDASVCFTEETGIGWDRVQHALRVLSRLSGAGEIRLVNLTETELGVTDERR